MSQKYLLFGGLFLVLFGGALFFGSPSLSSKNVSSESNDVVVYKSLSCGCCEGYIDILKEAGFNVEIVNLDDLSPIKERFGIPESEGDLAGMGNSHITVIGGYFVDGHVPLEAVNKLLKEKPGIDGISLPDMPLGSPGMTGEKAAPFEIVAIKDGVRQGVFLVV